jgi:dihydrodipicolinate synthase/N-acetylneuraminate lyase
MRFAGILPAVITPFTTHDEIDLAALRANAEAVVAGGAAGLVANGTMGEAGSLSDDERRTVIETCVAVAGELPVVVGVSSGSTAASARYAAMARECGAHGLMCLPPLNYPGDAREVVAHYRAVAAAGGGRPIMAYNNPAASGVDLTPDVIAQLAAEVPEIVAVKECSGDARRIAALVNDTDLDILIGGDDWALEGYAAGAVGWVSGVANVAPRECADLQALVGDGRLEEARAVYRRLLPLARLDMTPKLVQYFKGAMDAVGLRGGPTRPPRLPLTEAERDVLHAAVAALHEPAVA